MTIRAAADGSALGNPGPAGWAWYVDDNCWAAGGWKHATNNQGELMAVLQFFKATEHLDDDLLILCDSQYVINCVTKWMAGWKRKGWRKADGKPVLNVELLKEIDAAIVARRYRFEWVKGHANHPLNEAADARARAVSEAFQRGAAIPAGPGFGSQKAAVAWTPEVDAAPAAPVMSAAPVDNSLFSLFSLDDATPADDPADELARTPTGHEITVSLSDDQFARLRARAASAGITPAEALLRLV